MEQIEDNNDDAASFIDSHSRANAFVDYTAEGNGRGGWTMAKEEKMGRMTQHRSRSPVGEMRRQWGDWICGLDARRHFFPGRSSSIGGWGHAGGGERRGRGSGFETSCLCNYARTVSALIESRCIMIITLRTVTPGTHSLLINRHCCFSPLPFSGTIFGEPASVLIRALARVSASRRMLRN